MTYLSLYRKWRPQSFEEVVGQRHITQTLANAVKRDRVVHAYLFCGPRGTGKTSVAKILAKAVNCEKGPTPTPCNKCDVCQEITAGTSSDVLEIDAASNRGIDDVRELRERVRYAPTRGKKRVYIIDEVHMLTPEAFNALLKTLEEPPSHVIFVLATTEPHKVLPTILSRCQRYDFRRLSISDIAKRVKEIAQKEKVEIEGGAIGLVARYARGSLRDALGALEQLSAFSGKQISKEDAVSLLGTTDFDSLYGMAEALARRDTKAALLATEELAEKGQDLRQFAKDLIEYLRQLFLMASVTDHERVVDIERDYLEKVKGQLGVFRPFQILRFIEILTVAYKEMRWEGDGRVLLEVALVRMIRSEIDVSLEGLINRIEELELRTGRGSLLPDEEQVPVGAAQGDIEAGSTRTADKERSSHQKKQSSKTDLGKVMRAWPVILERVKKKKISTYALLLECQPCKLDKGKLVLEFRASAGFHKEEVEKETNQKIIQDALREVFGENIKVSCIVGEDKEAPTEADVSGNDNLTKRHAIEMLRDSFGAEIIEEQEQA